MKDPNKFIFVKTHKGSRASVLAGFELLSREKFLLEVKSTDKKSYRDVFRYGTLDLGTVKKVSHMSLKEFDEVFYKETFTEEEFERIFGSEVNRKYGKAAVQAREFVALKSKDAVVGGVYATECGDEFVYLGLVKQSTTASYYYDSPSEKKNRLPVVVEGFGYQRLYDFRNGGGFRLDDNGVNITKSRKRLAAKLIRTLDLADTYAYAKDPSSYRRGVIIMLELKEVDGSEKEEPDTD